MSKRRAVGIFIFDEVEVLDFCGPFEVFSSAYSPEEGGADAETEGDAEGRRLFDVRVVAEERRTVSARGGLRVEPHHGIDDCPPLDVLLVPGGHGTRALMGNRRVLDWIAAQDAAVETTTSVCTGSFLLAKAGLLDGRRATTHWASISQLRSLFPRVSVLDDARVVDEGRVVTSAGVSAGIDMALHLVERWHGREVAEATARDMEYEWRPATSAP